MKRKPLTRGKALIEARQILGPSAHVRMHAGCGGCEHPCLSGSFAVGTFDERGFAELASGASWGEALAHLRSAVLNGLCREAQTWQAEHKADLSLVRRVKLLWRAFYATAKQGTTKRELRRVIGWVCG